MEIVPMLKVAPTDKNPTFQTNLCMSEKPCSESIVSQILTPPSSPPQALSVINKTLSGPSLL